MNIDQSDTNLTIKTIVSSFPHTHTCICYSLQYYQWHTDTIIRHC